MIDLLILLMRPALRATDAGSKNPFDILAALIAWPLDVLIAHTTWSLVAGWPKAGEWTISDTLERLSVDISNPDWVLYVGLSKKINRVSPNHIKAVTQ